MKRRRQEPASCPMMNKSNKSMNFSLVLILATSTFQSCPITTAAHLIQNHQQHYLRRRLGNGDYQPIPDDDNPFKDVFWPTAAPPLSQSETIRVDNGDSVNDSESPSPTGQQVSAPVNTNHPTESIKPSPSPSKSPSVSPTYSQIPSISPTRKPTETAQPSPSPSEFPTVQPTLFPTARPTPMPSRNPTEPLSIEPFLEPFFRPTAMPTPVPTPQPTLYPTFFPSTLRAVPGQPTAMPTTIPPGPTIFPTQSPSRDPTLFPTPGPSVSPSAFTPEQQMIQATADPTAAPSNTPFSLHLSASPTLQPMPATTEATFMPATLPVTSQPSPSPSDRQLLDTPELTATPTNMITATEPSISFPTFVPTKVPTVEEGPTKAPAFPELEPSTESSNNGVTASPTKASESPASVLTESPVFTSAPTESTTTSPVFQPTLLPQNISQNLETVAPQSVPTSTTTATSSPTTVNTAPLSQAPTSASTATVVEFATNPFQVTVVFEEILDDVTVQAVSLELNTVVADYLKQELQGTQVGQELKRLTLNSSVTADSPTVLVQGRRQRRLDEEQNTFHLYRYDMDGTVAVESFDSELDVNQLKQAFDEQVVDILDDPDSQSELTSYLRSHPDSSQLRQTNGAIGVVEQPESGKKRPSIVRIIFGFLLVFLMMASLLFYLWIFVKGRRKRAAQRRREREGIQAVVPTANKTPQSPKVPGPVPAATATNEDFSSSDGEGSSYQGVESPDSSVQVEGDSFAKELELAATLDKRAWDEYQRKLREIEGDGAMVGQAPPTPPRSQLHSPSSREQGDDERDAVEVTQTGSELIIAPVAGGPPLSPKEKTSATAIRAQSFPYGDEQQQQMDPPGPRVSQRNITVEASQHQDPSGVRGSQLHLIPQVTAVSGAGRASGITTIEEDSEEEKQSPSGTERQDSGKNWSTIDTVGDGDSYDPALELMESLTSTQNSTRSHLQSGKGPSHPFDDEASASRALENLRASPSSMQAVMFPPGTPTGVNGKHPRASPATTIGSSNAVAGDQGRRISQSEDEMSGEKSKESSSLLTLDIVKEVQKLSMFVKKYEQKREKEAQKKGIPGSRPSPSVGYDSLATEQGAESVETSDRPTMSPWSPYADSETDTSVDSSSIGSVDDTDEKISSPVNGMNLLPPLAPNQGSALGRRPGEADDASISSDSVFSDEEEKVDPYESDSNDSRLGITPFSAQNQSKKPIYQPPKARMIPKPIQTANSVEIAKPKSRPPVTGNVLTSTPLSPIPGTPATPANDSQGLKSSPLDRFNPSPLHQRSTPASNGGTPHQAHILPGVANVNRAAMSPLQQSSNFNDSLRVDIGRNPSSVGPRNRSLQSNQSGSNASRVQQTSYTENPTLDRNQSPRISPRATNPTQPGFVLPRRSPEANTQAQAPPQHSSGPGRRISHLRGINQAILDTAPSDEDTTNRGRQSGATIPNGLGYPTEEEKKKPVAHPYTPNRSQTLPTKANGVVGPVKVTPRKSGNSGFNNILSMFESKQHDAGGLFPPGENWQYSSSG